MTNTHFKARPLTIAALMAGVALVLFFIANFVPVFGMIVRFVVGVPLVITVVLTGSLMYGVLAGIVGGLLVGLSMGPLAGVQMLLVFVLPALVMGYLCQKGVTSSRIFVRTTFAALAGVVIYYLAMMQVLSIDFASFMTEIEKVKDEVWFFYQESGLLTRLEQQSVGAVEDLKASVETSFYYIVRLLPAFLAMVVLAQVLVQYLVSGRILRSVNVPFQKLPAFSQWYMPAATMVPFLFAWVLFLLRDYLPVWSGIEVIVLNVLLFSLFLAAIDGISYLYYQFTSIKMGRFMQVTMIFFTVFFVHIVLMIAAAVGIFDSFLDFRKKQQTHKEG